MLQSLPGAAVTGLISVRRWGMPAQKATARFAATVTVVPLTS